MKFRFFLLNILSVIAILSASADEKPRRYELNVNDFSKLQVDNHISVDYRCNPDSAGIAIFTATPEQASMILFDNNGKGRLAIQADSDRPEKMHLPHVTIYSSSLNKIVNSGDSLVRIDGLPQMDKFSAILVGNGRLAVHDIHANKVDASIHSGNGQLIISGACTAAKFHLVGTGTIQADRLDAVTAKASVIGTGTIGCNVTESLTVMGMGSGKVYYRSEPQQIKSRGMGIKHSTFENL